jgi:hypothetical protein
MGVPFFGRPSVSNASSCTLIAPSCNGHGLCAVNAAAPGISLCACQIEKYDPYPPSHCGVLFSDAAPEAYVAVYSVLTVLYLILLAPFLFEIYIGARRGEWRSLTNVAKLACLLYMLLNVWNTISFIVESATGTLGPLAYQVALNACNSIKGVIMSVAYMACSISWLSLVMRAKELGMKTRAAHYLQRAVYVVGFGITPLGAVFIILRDTGAMPAASANMVVHVTLAITVVFVVIVTTIYSARVIHWQRHAKALVKQSRLMRRVFAKNRIVLAINAVYVVVVLAIVVVPKGNVARDVLVRNALIQLSSLALLVVFYLFLENHGKAFIWLLFRCDTSAVGAAVAMVTLTSAARATSSVKSASASATASASKSKSGPIQETPTQEREDV